MVVKSSTESSSTVEVLYLTGAVLGSAKPNTGVLKGKVCKYGSV